MNLKEDTNIKYSINDMILRGTIIVVLKKSSKLSKIITSLL